MLSGKLNHRSPLIDFVLCRPSVMKDSASYRDDGVHSPTWKGVVGNMAIRLLR